MDDRKTRIWVAKGGGHAREKEEKEGQPYAAAPRRVASALGPTSSKRCPKAKAQLLPRRTPRPTAARRTQQWSNFDAQTEFSSPGIVLSKTTPVVPSPTPLERTPGSARLTVLVVPTSTVRRPTGAITGLIAECNMVLRRSKEEKKGQRRKLRTYTKGFGCGL